MKVSLGLLPSGPDPVGEEHVRANLPKVYMTKDCGDGKGWGLICVLDKAASALGRPVEFVASDRRYA